ncbi:hypothetical protein ACOIC7_30420, partial [Klebsiella pneumoniae]|uniref:hypothetical protein n=1 Tax=Klebsiella pneumoniae TaxID=573 RepID=UPI003B5CC7AC
MGHGLEGLPELRFGKSTPKVPQLVIELQNRPKTGYNTSPNLQNQCKPGPLVVLKPVLSNVADV